MLITIREAAELLKVTEQTAYAWARSNMIPGVLRIGRTIRVDDEEIQDFIRRGGNRGLAPADVQRFSVTLQVGKSHAGSSPGMTPAGQFRWMRRQRRSRLTRDQIRSKLRKSGSDATESHVLGSDLSPG